MEGALWAENVLKETRALGWAAVHYINARLVGSGGRPPSLLSPARFAPAPIVLAAGGPLDPCRADALVLARRLRTAARDVVWRDYPTLIHGFGNLTQVSEAARRAVAEIGGLVGEMLS
jgi:acetyl esterase